MSIDEWLARFGWAPGGCFTGEGVTPKFAASVAARVSASPPPVGAYTARAGDWWVYG